MQQTKPEASCIAIHSVEEKSDLGGAVPQAPNIPPYSESSKLGLPRYPRVNFELQYM